MKENLKPGTVLAKADFRLTGKGWDDHPIDEIVHATLCVSGAFQYGNQTSMTLEWEARKGWNRVESYDTRYEKVSAKTFASFAQKVIEGQVMDTITVKAI